MKNKPLLPYRITALIIPAIFIAIYSSQKALINLITQVPPCPFYSHFHYYCPACGNTRSMSALFRGDILSAIRYNLTPILFGLFILIAYVELVTYSFGKHIRLLPRRLIIYIILIVILMLYLIIRNFIPYLTP